MRAALGRTWFGTLTLSAQAQFQMMLQAGARTRRRGSDFQLLTPAAQFTARHQQINRELTLWLKRIRKESGSKFRYILVAEAHKSGLPHYHTLIHECEGKPIRHSMLKKQWKLGFSDFKLVAQDGDTRAAYYVAKYLAKSATARVRASQAYGGGIDDISQFICENPSPPISDDNKNENSYVEPMTIKGSPSRDDLFILSNGS
jgi:hypothetical protein